MLPWQRGPIYEPEDSRFRPYSIFTLIAFLSAGFSVVCFASRRWTYVVEEGRS
jgi:hypothetical protein